MSGVNKRTTSSFETGKLHLACGGLETGEAKHLGLPDQRASAKLPYSRNENPIEEHQDDIGNTRAGGKQ